MTLAIVTDSTASLPADTASARDVTVVPLEVVVDGRSYTEGLDVTPADLALLPVEGGARVAIVEHAETKKELFRAADAAMSADAVLASNTSSIPITELAAVTSRPGRVIGMHFFNPVPVQALVEVIRAEQTSDETAAAIVDLARDLGKTPAEANDYPGFVSNRILMPFVNEAAYALMEGVAEPALGDQPLQQPRRREALAVHDLIAEHENLHVPAEIADPA